MDIETMKTVCMVAKTGSFSITAELLPCSQPTVSRRVKIAERDLGVTIFNRHSNRESVTLTSNGEDIVRCFENIINNYDDLIIKFKKNADDAAFNTITVCVAGNTMITPTGLDLMYSDFVSIYKNLTLKLIRDTETNAIQQLKLGKYDYALLVRYVWNNSPPFIQYELDDQLTVLNLAKHGLLISTSELNELAKLDSLTMEQLENVPFIYSGHIHRIPSNSTPTVHLVFFEACRMSGFTTNILALEHHSRSYRFQAVVAGQGSNHCAIPERLGAYAGIKYIPISDAPIHGSFFLVSQKNKNAKELAAVRDWLKSYFE